MKASKALLASGIAAVLACSGLLPTQADETTSPKQPPAVPSDYQPQQVKPVAGAQQAVNDQRGIIALSNCSASLVRMPNSQMSDKALMLTNGHCMYGGRFPKPGDVVLDGDTNLRGSILDDNSEAVMDIRGTRILYGTMTKTDAALVELTTTFQAIKDRTGIDAIPMATRGPKVGDALTVNSGYWKELYRCPMVKEVYELHEAGYVWKQAVKYRDNCGTKHGTSGSPVIDDKTGEVVAVNNTGSDNGERCTMNNPCEIDENGEVYYKKGTNYGGQTQWFNTCWTDQRTIDLKKPGCQLEGGVGGNPSPTPSATPTPTQSATPTPTPTPSDNPASGEVIVTDSNYRDVVAQSNNKPVVFLVGASWSRFTNQQLPLVRAKNDADRGSWTLGTVLADNAQEAARYFSPRAYPTLMVYSDGKEMTSPVRIADGNMDQGQINAWIDRAVEAWKAEHQPTPTPTASATPTPTPTPTPSGTPTVIPGDRIIDVTDANFDQVKARSSETPVVFVVGATWSTMTKRLMPRMEQANQAKDGWILARVYSDNAPNAATSFDVRGYPTVVAWARGKEMTSPARFADGTRSQEQVNTFIDEVLKGFGGDKPATDVVVDVANDADWAKVKKISNDRPVVVRLHADEWIPSNAEQGKDIDGLAKADKGAWTLANVQIMGPMHLTVGNELGNDAIQGPPAAMVVLRNGKVSTQVEPLRQLTPNSDVLREWIAQVKKL